MTSIEDVSVVEEDVHGTEDESQEKKYLYPIDRDKIKVTVNNWTIFTFKEYLKREKIELQPVFQRSYVWNDDKASGLIDSIWKGLPIPQIFLLTKEDSKSLVIDGQQRLTSIARFIFSESDLIKYLPNIAFAESNRVGSLKLKVPKTIFFPGAEENELISFEDLDENMKDRFEGESLIVAQINPTYSLFQGDKKAISDISKEIFNRLNTGGVKLTSQEIRQSLYSGYFMQEIQKISFSTEWRNILPERIKKLNQDPAYSAEILLRSMAFFDSFREDGIDLNYFKPLDSFLDKYAEIANGFSREDSDKRINLLKSLINSLNHMEDLGHNLFRHTLSNSSTGEGLRGTFNIRYVDTLFVGLLYLTSRNPNATIQEIHEKIVNFKKDINIIETYIISQGGGDATYTSNRVMAGIVFFRL